MEPDTAQRQESGGQSTTAAQEIIKETERLLWNILFSSEVFCRYHEGRCSFLNFLERRLLIIVTVGSFLALFFDGVIAKYLSISLFAVSLILLVYRPAARAASHNHLKELFGLLIGKMENEYRKDNPSREVYFSLNTEYNALITKENLEYRALEAACYNDTMQHRGCDLSGANCIPFIHRLFMNIFRFKNFGLVTKPEKDKKLDSL